MFGFVFRSGFYMSEILYLYGELDRRVRPLVFTVRRWAKDQGLIQDSRPTQSFTNFTVTLLVLFFLQKKYNMLPPLRELERLASKSDIRRPDDYP
jgi:poly(A) RNA polymerase